MKPFKLYTNILKMWRNNSIYNNLFIYLLVILCSEFSSRIVSPMKIWPIVWEKVVTRHNIKFGSILYDVILPLTIFGCAYIWEEWLAGLIKGGIIWQFFSKVFPLLQTDILSNFGLPETSTIFDMDPGKHNAVLLCSRH